MRRSTRVITFLFLAFAAIGIQGGLLAEGQSQGDGAAQAAAPRAERSSGLYIVQMMDLPAVPYADRLTNNQAQPAGQKQKLNANTPTVASWAGYLNAQHDTALARVGGRKVYDYRYIFNGFAARTERGASRAAQDAAWRPQRDEGRPAVRRHVVDANLPRPGCAGRVVGSARWRRQRRRRHRHRRHRLGNLAGEHQLHRTDAVAQRQGQGTELRARSRAGSDDVRAASSSCPKYCNGKIIGARHFNEAWGGDAGLKAERPWEFASPRDYNGHGTHTASTAGGNHDVALDRAAAVFGRISGIAPRARIAVYKALWSTQDGAHGLRLHLRPRRRDRSGGRRRRGRDQLLDQRHDDQLPRPGGDVVPVRRRRRRVRGGVGRQLRSDRRHRRASRRRGSRRSPPARTIATAKARSRSATAPRLEGASMADRRRARAV